MQTDLAKATVEPNSGNCSIARSLEIVGDKWTLLILREAWYGVARFSDFEKRLGCPRNLLSERLKMLVREGVMRAQEYHDPGSRVRQEYVLTSKGQELLPVAVALMNWGDKYLADESGPPILLKHVGCDQSIKAELVCEAAHAVEDGQVVVERGPAFLSRSK